MKSKEVVWPFWVPWCKFPCYFSVHKTFVFIVSVSIHDCRICTHHWPQRVIKTPWKSSWVLDSLKVVRHACWECQHLEVGRGMMRPSHWLCVGFPLSGAFSQTSVELLIRQPFTPVFTYKSSASPANHFPKSNLNGQKHIQYFQTRTLETSEGIKMIFLYIVRRCLLCREVLGVSIDSCSEGTFLWCPH